MNTRPLGEAVSPPPAVPGQPGKLADPPAEVADRPAGEPPRSSRPRPHEILWAGYFALTGLFVLAFGSPTSDWLPVLGAHAACVALLLIGLPRLPERGAWRVVRDWVLVAVFPLAYWEVALLNDLFTAGYYDREVLWLEGALFRSQPSVVLRRMLPWRPLSEYLHFGYFAYYALGPALAVPLYVRGRVAAFRYVLTVTFAVFFVCYVCFILFPVAGPWYVFARPSAESMGWVFPRLEHALLEQAASQGAAFPSSHAAAAVVIWLLAWRLDRRIFRLLSPVVPALVVGTVYGGFHYAVDALAGVLVAVAGYLAGPRIQRALGGELPPEYGGPNASRVSGPRGG
ncbi:MAG: inositol phosphorylceramide synthase [Gemmatimonadetes bacterium]|nr:inositol phosphorylceramide synthase [Gemmatimonadota bacterium]